MIEIREDLLLKLKCSMCKDYLSCAPIFTKANGKSICGRCPTDDDENIIRNIPYEELASITLFPCINQSVGCDKKVAFNKVANHEKYCHFTKFNCPIEPVNICEWTGKRVSFYQHCKDTHPAHVYTNSKRFEHNIMTNNDRNMVLMFSGLVFLVQYKVSVAQSKIWHCVRYIGNANLTSQFHFEVKIICNEKLIKVSKQVAAQNRLIIEQKCSIETCINSLLILFGSTFKNVYFSITISKQVDLQLLAKVICIRCRKYAKEEIYICETEKGCVCYNCNSDKEVKNEYLMDLSTQLFYPCNYKENGCNYIDVMTNVVRHENFFCNYSKCLICSQCVSGSKKNHYDKHHAKLISQTMKISHKKIAIKEFQYSIIHNMDSFFICGCGEQDDTFIFFVSSELPLQVLELYKCCIRISNPKSNIALEKSTDLRRDNRYDCIIYIPNVKFEKYLCNQKYNIVIEIVQK